MNYARDLLEALLLAAPVACVVWTITHEEIFRELREVLARIQKRPTTSWWKRKVAYMPTCPFCCSHYVAAIFVFLFQFKMLANDWRGYVASLFTVVLVANFYLTAYHLLRISLRRGKALADKAEVEVHRPGRTGGRHETHQEPAWTVLRRPREAAIPNDDGYRWPARRFPAPPARRVEV